MKGYCSGQKVIGKTRVVGFFWILPTLLLFPSCTGEDIPDCVQAKGEVSREEVVVEPFTVITAAENITLVIKQGPLQRVEIETGENLRNEVEVRVEDGTLLLKDTNDCNLFRDYGTTTVYVTAPEITEIRSSSGFPIRSDGILNYESLILYSESFLNSDAQTTDGSFDLSLSSTRLSVVVNGIAYFKLRGDVAELEITIAAGDSRIEAAELSADRVLVNHRGSNDILIHPLESLVGVIRGTGDVISNTMPATVEVEELYTGKLIFRN